MDEPTRPMAYEEMEAEMARMRAALERIGNLRPIDYNDMQSLGEMVNEGLGKFDERSVTERLSEYAHEAWSGWLQYMFKEGRLSGTGELVIPKKLALRWNRQMSTPYDALPEDEKDSDRQEARKMIAIFCKKQV